MAAVLIRPIWVAATQRFRNRVTGRFISAKVAAPFLRSGGGAFRDILGRFVPNRFLGGLVTRTWPTGAADIAAVTRAIPGDPSGVLYRSGDIAAATISYVHPVEGPTKTYVTMPRGREYNEEIFQERLRRRLIGLTKDGCGTLLDIPEVLEDEIEWHITTQYQEGEYLGGDVARFEG